MERIAVKWEPRWYGPIEGAAVNLISKNLWRVPAEMEWDDLYQDAYLVYRRCKGKYGATVDGPAHFMCLFRTAFGRHLIDLANERTRRAGEFAMSAAVKGGETRPVSPGALAADARWASIRPGAEAAEAELRLLLEDAPPDIRNLVIGLLARAAAEKPRPAYARHRGRRETTAEYLCHLAGVSLDRGIIERLRAWLSGDTIPA